MGIKKYPDEYIESLVKRIIDKEITEQEYNLLKGTGVRSHEHVLKKFKFERRKINEKSVEN
ncbi:hypothetical protein MWG07_09970 [Fusobacterium necrophorum]|uniref:Uncharacterized protein n=2 Tax=Fusobacterium necrophorum TaxID=859 RepID=A0A162IQ19_9FUSO|nr:hypothetical protein [Fusobacterium necrophorum]EFS22868.1 hypothetical protein FSEG_00475 [Fusobacterium necrophorum D12]KYL03689.1 hypothetical protein A2J07_11210 [Fusobacterium necrophorum subsp. funduliforme]KYM55959.1 hypothetical protein A2U07_11220 [Fusobacterium necrophorum subsp. funduliforme]MDK4481517.1 hypothetical protein [Fusobacterium necrophorum]MDK4504329.1 hypothetical protein [Fusobacterium necrophorum]